MLNVDVPFSVCVIKHDSYDITTKRHTGNAVFIIHNALVIVGNKNNENITRLRAGRVQEEEICIRQDWLIKRREHIGYNIMTIDHDKNQLGSPRIICQFWWLGTKQQSFVM